MSDDRPAVGLIGLGVMGRPMAANLLVRGFDVVVNSRRTAPPELLAAGAVEASSPTDVGRRATVVLTILPDDEAVRSVVAAVADGAAPGTTIVDLSTITPLTVRALQRDLASRGLAFVDAPVSGGERGARTAMLSIMVGGNDADVARVRPVLEALGTRITHIGGPGAGQVAKAANQVVVGLTIQAVAEALSLAERSGADMERIREALLGGFAQSTVLDQHGARMIAADFAPGARLTLHRKDLRIAQELADQVDAETPATDALAATMDALIAAGDGGLDHSALIRHYGRGR